MMNILIVLVVFYGLILILYYLFQSAFIFFPQPLMQPVQLTEHVEEVEIRSAGNPSLHGWLCKNPAEGPQKLIIYFGGNAEEVSHLVYEASRFEGWSLLLINYPGYGKSRGKPGEKSFFRAALDIYDYAVSREDIDPGNIILMGRSIGTGSAAYLAHKRPVKGVILVSPFESIRAVAQSKLPFLPVGLMLRHPFRSGQYAKSIHAPLLAFYGTADQIIPPQHTKKLVAAWAGPKRVVELQGYGHNNIFDSPKMWNEVIRFLDELE